ncbi:MAG: endonuclease/exonuclease/phosphatase family protein [Candidatus Cloacimonetes bacterium]|nr:endonuclease/exonuclease/phosphatase family protein [Candidatus Cloacimonadota bacterium]MCF7813103.1 endonuclease/exonuclease/phosphatase family protein [Candidatus Cloacimonadota bacterium]MCF7867551.1 endonuclease/exonuclease/phosphatase family protein [Candidatus Cloacimonadota bacterium]MCF7883055.1 endonuclease/exonuclease/phosphatase family protein [Candidatus Cloacimonadota bacterium]
MRKIIFAFCFLLFAILESEELPEIEYDKLEVGEEQTLEVMTWNIQNFPKSDFTIDYAADIINAVDPDIIGFQEIESDSAFFCLIDQLNALDKHNWSGYRANRNYWKLELAFIYKTDLIGVSGIYEIFFGEWQPFPRSPLVLECTFADQEIIIVNNHFKARTGAENEARRRAAVEKLDAWILANHPDDNVIVLGDLNDQLIDEGAANVFTSLLQKPAEYRFVDYEIAQNDSADWSYPYWKYRGHIDHILISNELYDEFESSQEFVKVVTIDKFMEGGDDARYKYITDHRPVVVKLKFEMPEEEKE